MMKPARLTLTVAFAAIAFCFPLQAHHVIWLDFSNFNLNSFSSVNGNSPPAASDVAAVRRLVVANMVEDYATFDVYFTTSQPNNGRYTRVRILGTDNGGLFGCAGPSCCLNAGNCSGIDAWDDVTVSSCEVYSGSFSNYSEFTGSNATTSRIANGISHTASHELGHVLGLGHCNAADDSITIGCSGITSSTDDQNPRWHVMASGTSWGLTMTERATRDRFFSVHASRRMLGARVQQKNHWDVMGNYNGGAGWTDLAYGRVLSPTVMRWYVRLSTGSTFGSYSTWATDAGDAGDIFLTGDVNGDGRSDLVYGRIVSSSQVVWYVRRSNGTGFGTWEVWSSDAGDAGDIFRLGDVNGDGRDDLVYGRPLSTTVVRWYARMSTGNSFGPWSTWSTDAGDIGDLFFLADVDADGDDDLVYGRAVTASQVKWWVRRSNGSTFGALETWREDAGDFGDLFYVADTGGDGDADLLYARTLSDTQVRWYYRPSLGNMFGALQVWSNDAGDAGDVFRIGDGNGDGFLDLFYARPLGMTSLTATPNLNWIRWYGRFSLGGSFGPFSTWASDAGDEGDISP
jgi:hypothetical protein